MNNKFIIECKPTDGRFGTPDEWRNETIPMEQEQAEKILEKREFNVGVYDGVPNFHYRLTEIGQEKPKKNKKVKKKS
tara:strand:- start:80 stop:310 length:231 start_codon:yes stop_codon:yes gene_type:complete